MTTPKTDNLTACNAPETTCQSLTNDYELSTNNSHEAVASQAQPPALNAPQRQLRPSQHHRPVARADKYGPTHSFGAGGADFYLIKLANDSMPYSIIVDIKPGSYPNSINLGSHGLIPVAILSSDEFDATTVDPETVELGGAGVGIRGKSNKFMAHQEDVNTDGIVDIVVQVATENLEPDFFQNGYAILTGATTDGREIEGADEIRIVPE